MSIPPSSNVRVPKEPVIDTEPRPAVPPSAPSNSKSPASISVPASMFTDAENEMPLSVAPVIVKSTPALLYTPSPENVSADVGIAFEPSVSTAVDVAAVAATAATATVTASALPRPE